MDAVIRWRPGGSCRFRPTWSSRGRVRRHNTVTRVTGGLFALVVALNGVLALARTDDADFVLDNVACTEGSEVVLTAHVRNSSDRVTFGSEVTATVEVASGDRFEGSARVHLGPGESLTVEVPTDLTGAVLVCEARMPEILSRVKTNP